MRDHPLYRHRGKLLLLLLAVMLLALLLPTGTERESPVPEETAPPAIMPAPEPAGDDGGAIAREAPAARGDATAAPAGAADLRRSIADLELALAAAVEERKRAEAALEQSEQDVVELERYIEEIEERGEDPTDYADEGLEKFRPAFFAFEEASARLEQAELSEAALREELAAAERRLAALESR